MFPCQKYLSSPWPWIIPDSSKLPAQPTGKSKGLISSAETNVMEILEICPIILEGRLKKKCPSLATSKIKKNWDKNPSNLASHLGFDLTPDQAFSSFCIPPPLSAGTDNFRIFPLSTHSLSQESWFSHLHSRVLCALPIFFWMEGVLEKGKQTKLQTWDSFLITVHSFNAYKIKARNRVTKNDLPSKLQHFPWLKLTYKLQRNKLCFSSLYL